MIHEKYFFIENLIQGHLKMNNLSFEIIIFSDSKNVFNVKNKRISLMKKKFSLIIRILFT